jgi:hypothetical protein
MNLFSAWIIEMDHHECTTGEGLGCTSECFSERDVSFSMISLKAIMI